MRLAFHGHDGIFRNRQATGLQKLLQASLRVLAGVPWIDRGELALEHSLNRDTRGFESRIEPYRSEHRFQRVGENRRPARAAASGLAFAQPYRCAKIVGERESVQGVPVDKIGAKARKLAFGQLRKSLIQRHGNHAIEDAVPDELEALVLIRAEAAMRQRLAQQFRTTKSVTERW